MKNILLFLFVLLNLVRVQAQVTATVNHPSGCGSEDGYICLKIEGEGPFEIDWTMEVPDPVVNTTTPTSGVIQQPVEEWNNQTCIKGLKAGKYCVTVRNATCCQAEQCFELNDGEEAIKVINKQNTRFCIRSDSKTLPPAEGSIEIGGMSNPDDWDFLWTNKDQPWQKWKTQNLSLLASGTYLLTATNKKTGCVQKLEVSICCCILLVI